MEQPRATSLGGVFFKVEDPEATRNWYSEHLGLTTDDYGTNFEWRKINKEAKGYTLWSPFPSKSDYFEEPFMINFRVNDLSGLLKELEAKGVQIASEVTQESYGKFVHIIDGDGQKIELWEPNDEAYEEMVGDSKTSD